MTLDSSAMSRTRIALLCALCLPLAACLATAEPEQAATPTFYDDLSSAGRQLDASAARSMVSGYRRNNGLNAVTTHPVLMRLCQEQAASMAQRDRLDHSAKSAFQDRMARSGYNPQLAVENIGAGYHTLAEAFSGWRDSPSHRANMLKAGAVHMGVAAARAPNSKYKVYWCLILAAPAERRR